MKEKLSAVSGKLHFPTVHLVAVSICVVILAITLTLLPSKRVEATRSSQPLELEVAAPEPALSKTDPIAALADKVAPQPEQTPPPPAAAQENWLKFKVGKGDTLSGMFDKAGLPARTALAVANAAKGKKAFNRIYPGESLQFLIEDGELVKARHVHNRLSSTIALRTDQGFRIDTIERAPDIELRYTEAVIDDSMFLAGERAGMPSRIIMSMASIFGWDIDFAMDIRKGDRFNILYEEKYLDGEKIGTGAIVAAEFTNQGRTYTALRYTDRDGNTSYYTPDGRSMRKAFLRTPVDFARISSYFNLKRKHPILNRIRAHKGVDYAASTGTPIRAAGDGKIIHRGRKGGYGNAVILQHGSNITTLYAHMNNYRRGQKVGSKVKQGDIIGYVGKTGLASGPHLHYEFRVNGVHKNPLKVKLPDAAPIRKGERERFAEMASLLLTQLRSQNGALLASSDSDKDQPHDNEG
ncbi:peptidoglycan DD-metalloendopeptidase family protein [Marinobacterium sp. CAU 1594]|nr:peptidoglycan DD-metalloendopeptidase family protein [Marinobacterium arenosum]